MLTVGMTPGAGEAELVREKEREKTLDQQPQRMDFVHTVAKKIFLISEAREQVQTWLRVRDLG